MLESKFVPPHSVVVEIAAKSIIHSVPSFQMVIKKY